MNILKNSINSNMENIPNSSQFEIIHKLVWKHKIIILCKIARVSVSWYYRYKSLLLKNQTQQQREEHDVKIIQSLTLKYNNRYWYRMITMLLQSKWIFWNHKKVLRVMSRYNLLSKVRKKNPYKNIAKETKEHRSFRNILNRNFSWKTPFTQLWTDISYLYYNGTKSYISILKDMVSWEVVSHKVSNNLWLDFVIETIKNASHKLKNWSIIQSDQWWHYTHPTYSNKLKELWVIQSMSRKWNCLDNAPTESFFWHMKDEINLENIHSFQELEIYINNYIFHYNYNRPQWNRKKMTPVQYRNHLLHLS
jgi:transposase InsO family protein